MIKRLFSATQSPDLYPTLHTDLVTQQEDGTYKIPVGVFNQSSAIARDIDVSLVVSNPDACDTIFTHGFEDQSGVNPGRRIFMNTQSAPIHRGLSRLVGYLFVRMKTGKRPRRRVDLSITLYADGMRARHVDYAVALTKTGMKVRELSRGFLY